MKLFKLSIGLIISAMLIFLSSCQKDNELSESLKNPKSELSEENQDIQEITYSYGENEYLVKTKIIMEHGEVIDSEILPGKDKEAVEEFLNMEDIGLLVINESNIHFYLNEEELNLATKKATGYDPVEGLAKYEEIKNDLAAYINDGVSTRTTCLNDLGYKMFKHCSDNTLMFQGNVANGLTSSFSTYVGNANNDEMSDLQIGGGEFDWGNNSLLLQERVTLYQHANFGGRRITFVKTGCGTWLVPCLTNYKMKLTKTWNDQVSSFRAQVFAF